MLINSYWYNVGCFQFLNTAPSDAVIIPGHMEESRSENIPGSANSGSKNLHTFNLIKYCQTSLQDDCIKLYPYQKNMSPYALNPSQHLVLSDLTHFADLMNQRTNSGYK